MSRKGELGAGPGLPWVLWLSVFWRRGVETAVLPPFAGEDWKKRGLEANWDARVLRGVLVACCDCDGFAPPLAGLLGGAWELLVFLLGVAVLRVRR